MLTLDQVRSLENRVAKALGYIDRLTDENAALRERLGGYERRIKDLEVLIRDFQQDQGRIEEGILSALEKLNVFEDAVLERAGDAAAAVPAAAESAEAGTMEAEPVAKEVEPAAKEAEPAAKEAEPAAKEAEPAAKEAEVPFRLRGRAETSKKTSPSAPHSPPASVVESGNVEIDEAEEIIETIEEGEPGLPDSQDATSGADASAASGELDIF
jgi:chromosome segregation ATPase